MKRLGFAVATVLALATGASAQNLSIATHGPYGGALAELIGKYFDAARASAEVTGASVENIALIAKGKPRSFGGAVFGLNLFLEW